MHDVSSEIDTYREATAEAVVAMPGEAQRRLRERSHDSGDALEIARTAGILAAKRAPELIPHCHGVLVTHAEVRYMFETDGVRITATVRAIGSTGVETHALTAASVAALTLNDVLAPVASPVEIRAVRIVASTGGHFRDRLEPAATVAVISIARSSDKAKDKAGKAVIDGLSGEPSMRLVEHVAVPAHADALREQVRQLVAAKTNIILTVGGTGLSPDDVVIDALAPLIEREIPGIMEAARAYGQRRTPLSMLSRGIAGMVGDTLLVTFPGSTRGARETVAALFPTLLHIVHGQRRFVAKIR